ncbi:hypothetical protein [Rubellicoccus peritrichatus]|uniref:DUF3137 domain-containing protein n=1 Tax=Rubellicoccus peritrichatus TaxID=3080537 RepID=A0AAQ3QW97_9BACT|nr:hypothetical protein [Puniceicoccus sp. CR14]WOO42453.1 hypothetical protein RZN69_05075 [Puniceicoccus sp. CR14]
MGILRSIFGPSKEEIWKQVAASIEGDYIDGGFWGKDELRYRSGEWEFLLDTYTVNSGNNTQTTYTRMRAPFINKDGLHFKIYRENFFSGIGKFFGMQDLVIGDDLFDNNFIIKGNYEDKVKLLLASQKLRDLIRQQPYISIEIKEDDGYFGTSFPSGVDMLYFTCYGVIKDVTLLHGLFEMFTCVLERLVEIDSAYESDPNVKL